MNDPNTTVGTYMNLAVKLTSESTDRGTPLPIYKIWKGGLAQRTLLSTPLSICTLKYAEA